MPSKKGPGRPPKQGHLTPDLLRSTLDMPRHEAAAYLGLSQRTYQRRLEALETQTVELVNPILSPDRSIDQILEDRRKSFSRQAKSAASKAMIEFKIKDSKPLGLFVFGDPHLDDDGTDIGLIESHMALINATPNCYAVNIGDVRNNWVGRLMALYAHQSITESEAWELAKWFFDGVPHLLHVGGNHCKWSGGRDLLPLLAKNAGQLYVDHGARLALTFANKRRVTINARHKFPGNSLYNVAHGVNRGSREAGILDNIVVAGHIHCSGYNILKNPVTKLVSHCIQVASYKIFDSYAEEMGLTDQNISPSVLVVINPEAKEAGLVTVFHDVEEGAAFLQSKHKKK